MPRAFLITNKRYNLNATFPTNKEDVENCPQVDGISICDLKTNTNVNTSLQSALNSSEAAAIKCFKNEIVGVPNDAESGHLSPMKPLGSATPTHLFNRISVLTHTAAALQTNSCNILKSVHISPSISKCAFQADSCGEANYSHNSTTSGNDFERDITEDEMQDEAQDLSVRSRFVYSAGYPNSPDEHNSKVLQSYHTLSLPQSPYASLTADCPMEYLSTPSTPESVDTLNATGGDNHICPDCDKRYSTSSNLARHRQTHRSVTDKKARKCPHCDKVYVSMPAYSMHVRTHSQGCQCPYCGKCFSRPWLLQGHIRTHTGEKPFKCPICSKAFADKSNLRAHIQTHSTTKPYSCQRCGKAFALKSYLYKHEESSCMRLHKHGSGGQLGYRHSSAPSFKN